jgi:hypothetical protein
MNADYCDGVERCAPGAEGAGADGCVAGTPPCSAMETCDEAADECVPMDCAEPDGDDDGDASLACGGGDCDDTNPNVRSGLPEACDALGVDEDCVSTTLYNEGPGTNDGDRDGDGFVDSRCFNVLEDGTENRGTDCDDAAPTINPDGVEACDLRDNDCDGSIDEDVLETYYRDADGDGAGDESMTMEGCTAPAGGWVLMAGDCDDTQSSVHPAATEVCDDRDNDCDSDVDEAPAGATYYRDADLDGFGDAATSMRVCGAPPAGWVTTVGDCWDGGASVRPGAGLQSAPFCRSGVLCGTICAGPPDGPFCGDRLGTPDWDYNCDGAVTTEPRGSGLCDEATTLFMCGGSIPLTMGFANPAPADCGRSIAYITGCAWNASTGTCGYATENRTLRCR